MKKKEEQSKWSKDKGIIQEPKILRTKGKKPRCKRTDVK